jgi:hypothetical protein
MNGGIARGFSTERDTILNSDDADLFSLKFDATTRRKNTRR